MRLTFLHLLFFSLFLGASAHALDIFKTWHLEGGQFTGNANVTAPFVSLYGTVEITANELRFATNQGAFTRGAALPDMGPAYTGPSLEYLFNETIPSEVPGAPPLLIRSTRVRVVVQDPNTLVLLFGRTSYPNGGNFMDYEWIGGVLTTAPLPIRTTPLTKAAPWAGRYNGTFFDFYGDNFGNGISATMGSYGGTFVRKPNGDFFAHFQGEEDIDTFGLTSSFEILSTIWSDTNLRVKWSNPIWDENGAVAGNLFAYLLEDRNEQRAIYLGDGRILIMESNSTRVDETVLYFSGGSNYIPPHMADSFLTCMLLTQESIGHVDVIQGTSVQVLRDGQKIPLALGDPFYEGDTVITGASSLVKIAFMDGASMTVSPNSEMKVESYRPGKPPLMTLIRGIILSYITGGFKSPRLMTVNTVMGPRGTEFDWSYLEENGTAVTSVEVIDGIVDVTDRATGQVHEVLAGQSRTVTSAVQAPSITLQVPGSGMGHVSINGNAVHSFPHTFTAPIGTELTIEAHPAAGLEFHRWWGNSEILTTAFTTVVSGSTVMNCEFRQPGYTAEDAFFEEAFAMGLTGADASQDAKPFEDGSPNLIKWAFNMNLDKADHRRLPLGGTSTAGLPVFGNMGGQPRLQFLRRTDGSISYRPMVSEDLVEWAPYAVIEDTQTLGDGWELVTIPANPPQPDGKARFFRVSVSLAVEAP